MAERKKPKTAPEAVRPETTSVGQTLRAARLARGIEVEDVSRSIHIRPTQLRAIEDNDIESLPGMTYAVGFVRSYANFLGLNGAEIVHRFKAEQGHGPAQAKLSFPEPIVESRVPDPMMVGVGAFLAVVILVIWTIYSNVHSGSKVADKVPPAPAVTSVTEALPPVAAPSATTTPTDTSSTATTPAVAPAPETVSGSTDQPAPAPVVAASAPPVKQAATDKKVSDKTVPAPATTDKTTTAPVKETAASSDGEEEDSAPAEDDTTTAKPAVKTTDDNVINIKKGKSRITLKATQASWIQVTDPQQNVLYRKVLRPGEQYPVPDQPGLILDTANAGGLDIVVDGKAVQSLGKPGEIMRGITLDPNELKIKKIKVRN